MPSVFLRMNWKICDRIIPHQQHLNGFYFVLERRPCMVLLAYFKNAIIKILTYSKNVILSLPGNVSKMLLIDTKRNCLLPTIIITISGISCHWIIFRMSLKCLSFCIDVGTLFSWKDVGLLSVLPLDLVWLLTSQVCPYCLEILHKVRKCFN